VSHLQPAEPATNPAPPGGAPAGLPGRGARVGTVAPVGRPAPGARIVALDCYDVRFPTSLEHDGSDAMNSDPDYSAAYAVLRTDAEGLEGHALCFTIGRGNDVVVAAVTTLRQHVVGKYVDDIVTVEEEEIANAVLLLLEREKMLAEGAGAAALAALINRRIPLLQGKPEKKVVVIVSGGNIDVTLLARIIERGLVKDGRLVRLRVHLPDYPGALHSVTGILAEHRANIVETSYDRAYHNVNLGDTAIDITMETRGPEHIAELIAALAANGYTHERIL